MTRQIYKLLFFIVSPDAVGLFQITDWLWPEIFLRDSRGKYTWAWRRADECIK